MLLLALHVGHGALETPLGLPEAVGVTHLSPTVVEVKHKSQLCTMPNTWSRKEGQRCLSLSRAGLSRIWPMRPQRDCREQQGAVADGCGTRDGHSCTVTCSPLVALRGTRHEQGSSLGLLRCCLAHIPFLLQWGKHAPAL